MNIETKSVFFLTYNHCEEIDITQKSLLKQLRENFRKNQPNIETKNKIVYYLITKEEYRNSASNSSEFHFHAIVQLKYDLDVKLTKKFFDYKMKNGEIIDCDYAKPVLIDMNAYVYITKIDSEPLTNIKFKKGKAKKNCLISQHIKKDEKRKNANFLVINELKFLQVLEKTNTFIIKDEISMESIYALNWFFYKNNKKVSFLLRDSEIFEQEKKIVNSTFLKKNNLDIDIVILYEPVYSVNCKSTHIIRFIKNCAFNSSFNCSNDNANVTKAIFILNEENAFYNCKAFKDIEKFIISQNEKGNYDTIIIDSFKDYVILGSEIDLKGKNQNKESMNFNLNIENAQSVVTNIHSLDKNTELILNLRDEIDLLKIRAERNEDLIKKLLNDVKNSYSNNLLFQNNEEPKQNY